MTGPLGLMDTSMRANGVEEGVVAAMERAMADEDTAAGRVQPSCAPNIVLAWVTPSP